MRWFFHGGRGSWWGNHNWLLHSFTRKRDEVKSLLYRNNIEAFPDTLRMLGSDVPLPIFKRQGKFMFKRVRADIHARFGVAVNLLETTTALKSCRLESILETVE